MRKLLFAVVVVCLLTTASLAQITIYRGSTETSLSVVTAAGPGAVLSVTQDSRGFFPAAWTWNSAFSGSPGTISLNLEGAIDYKTTCTDAAITSGAATLVSSCGQFVATDIGKEVQIAGAGAAGATLITTISAVTNSKTVTLVANAGTTVTAASYSIGRWFQLDNSTSTSAEMRHVANKPVLFIRCNLITISGGSSPKASCRIASF